MLQVLPIADCLSVPFHPLQASKVKAAKPALSAPRQRHQSRGGGSAPTMHAKDDVMREVRAVHCIGAWIIARRPIAI